MRTAKIVFISLLSVLILLVEIQTVFPFVNVPPLDEKRLLAPFPDFAGKILHGNGRLAADINRWFDDRVGFRPWTVRLSHQIEYSLFSHSDNVYIGRDGWLFGRDMIDEQVTSERAGSALELQLHETFRAAAHYLSKRNIRLIVVSNPIKDTINPELPPADAPHLPINGQFQRLRDFLKTNEDWIYLDGQDMLSNCREHQVFYRQDDHLTEPAGFCIAVQVVNRIAQEEGHDIPFWNPVFTFERSPPNPNGGLASFLSLLFPVSEVYDASDQAYRPDLPAVDGSFDRPAKHFYDHFYPYDPNRPFEWVYTANDQIKSSKLPPLVWYGNSFTDFYIGAGLQFQFSEVYRIRSTYVTLFEALQKLPSSAKYFLLQFYEPNLRVLAAAKVPE